MALLNRAGEVFIGRRARSREAKLVAGHEWQMPQGGIDEGEEPYAAALRELHEETNVSSTSLIAEAPDWLTYELPRRGRQSLAGALSRPDAEMVPAPLRGGGARDRHPPPGRRRPQARVRRLALGEARSRARPRRAVQAQRLRTGRRRLRAAGETGVGQAPPPPTALILSRPQSGRVEGRCRNRGIAARWSVLRGRFAAPRTSARCMALAVICSLVSFKSPLAPPRVSRPRAWRRRRRPRGRGRPCRPDRSRESRSKPRRGISRL